MRRGVYAIEDDPDVGQKFGNNVEGTCIHELLETARKGLKNTGGSR